MAADAGHCVYRGNVESNWQYRKGIMMAEKFKVVFDALTMGGSTVLLRSEKFALLQELETILNAEWNKREDGWISVEDELPPTGCGIGYTVVWLKPITTGWGSKVSLPFLGKLHVDGTKVWEVNTGNHNPVHCYSYWRPLPEPPIRPKQRPPVSPIDSDNLDTFDAFWDAMQKASEAFWSHVHNER